MERICSHCHAEVKLEGEADWCPACGGALIERAGSTMIDQGNNQRGGPAAEVDHRGIVLPRRHALGGIITPQ
jgi:predicted amidophosphoribosyltransferase